MGFAALAGTTTAVCTNWEQGRAHIDDGGSFSNHYTKSVDQLTCPASSDDDCEFAPKYYDFTAERDLLGAGGLPLGDLPEDELEAIFQLAADGFAQEFPASNGSNGSTNSTVEFKTLTTTLSTQDLPDSVDQVLEVDPAVNKTLTWTSYYVYSTGTLSGCSNETLNNVTVTAAAPYFTQDGSRNNQAVLAGGWGSISSNITGQQQGQDDAQGAAMSLVKRSAGTAISGLVVVTMVLAFVI